MKKTFLMPKMMLLAIFFIASIFTKVNAQIIVPDLACLKVYETVIIPGDTLIIRGNDAALVSVQIYEPITLDSMILRKNISFNNLDGLSKSISILKEKNKKNPPKQNGNKTLPLPNDQNMKKVIGKVWIKDLECANGKKYFLIINYATSNGNIDTGCVYLKRCPQGSSSGNTNEPNKNPNKN